jgi:hypothetical protein
MNIKNLIKTMLINLFFVALGVVCTLGVLYVYNERLAERPPIDQQLDSIDESEAVEVTQEEILPSSAEEISLFKVLPNNATERIGLYGITENDLKSLDDMLSDLIEMGILTSYNIYMNPNNAEEVHEEFVLFASDKLDEYTNKRRGEDHETVFNEMKDFGTWFATWDGP